MLIDTQILAATAVITLAPAARCRWAIVASGR
jgi:hypothetical protein